MSKTSASAAPATSEPAEARRSLRPLLDVIRRVPFTATVVGIMVVLAVVSQGLWRPLEESDWFPSAAYGLPAFEAGKWWTVVAGAFFARTPLQYLPVVGWFALMVGLCEWRLGTRMAALATFVGQVAGVLGAALLVAPLQDRWEWAAQVGAELDVGFSAGAVCALVLAATSLHAPWRGRLLIATLGYCLVSFVWVGLLWDVEHLIAAIVGLALGWPRLRGMFARERHMSRHEARVIAAGLLILIAFAQVVAMAFPDRGPLGPEQQVVGHPLVILFVIMELLVAAGLHRGSRLAWSAAMALAITGLATALSLRPIARGVAAAIVFLPLLILLVRSRRVYTASIVPPSSTRFWRDIGLIAAAFAGYVVLGFLLNDQFRPEPTPIMMVQELVARLFFTSSGRFEAISRPATLFLDSLSFIPIVVFFSMLLLLFLRSRKPTAAVDRDKAIALLHRYGGGDISWMSTWPDNAHFFTEDGEATLAFQVKSNTAIALGDPIGAPGSTALALREYGRFCELHGWVPCLFSVTGDVLPQAAALGWREVQVAEDTVIDLPNLAFKGKAWQDVRTALNRATKLGISFRMVQLRNESFAMVQQARGISDEWVSDKGLPEMGFTLGGVDEALDPEVRVGLAVDSSGVLQGITSWLPVYGPNSEIRGWTLDVMRRRPDGFRPVMEFMIASACLSFKEQGAQIVSLSGAPLARSEEDDNVTPVEAVLNQLGELLEPVYGFRSLHQFKTKFKPRYEPLFMVYPDEAALPRIGVALTQAFLPDARLRDYASMLTSRA